MGYCVIYFIFVFLDTYYDTCSISICIIKTIGLLGYKLIFAKLKNG